MALSCLKAVFFVFVFDLPVLTFARLPIAVLQAMVPGVGTGAVSTGVLKLFKLLYLGNLMIYYRYP